MNYITEINAFYDQLEINPLSTSAIVLWHALKHINNKAGWAEEFTVAVSVICVKTGLSDRTVTNARNELKQKGYLDFKSRKGNQSALYRLYKLSEINSRKSSYKEGLQEIDSDKFSDSVSGSSSDSVSGNASTLIREDKTREENDPPLLPTRTTVRVNPFILFEEEIGKLTGTVRDMMNDWLDGGYADEPEQLLCCAIREAAINEKRSLAYVNGVLERYIQQKIRTVAQLEQSEIKFKSQKVTPFRRDNRTGGGKRERCEVDRQADFSDAF